jgi:hypothetical protein
MPHKTWAANEDVLAADFNPNVADQIVARYANAGARSSGWPAPPVGAASTLDDNLGKLWLYTGTQWVRADWSSAWGAVAAPAVKTGLQTMNSASPVDVTGLAVTFTAVAGRRYKITAAYMTQMSGSGSSIQNHYIRNAAGTVLALVAGSPPSAAYMAWCIVAHDVPGAGAVTYKASISVNSLTCDVNATPPQTATLIVEDVGPTAPPTRSNKPGPGSDVDLEPLDLEPLEGYVEADPYPERLTDG